MQKLTDQSENGRSFSAFVRDLLCKNEVTNQKTADTILNGSSRSV